MHRHAASVKLGSACPSERATANKVLKFTKLIAPGLAAAADLDARVGLPCAGRG